MNIKKVIAYITFLGIGLFLLYRRFTLIPDEDKTKLFENIINAPLLAVGITFIMGLFAVISRGIRWNLLLEPLGYKASIKNSIASVAIGYLANTLIPRSGELARCTALHSTDDVPIDKLFGTVIIERVIDFVMLFLFLSIALISNFDSVVTFFSGINLPGGSSLVMIIIALGVLFIGLFVIIKRKSQSQGQNSIYSKILKFIRGMFDGIKSIRSMERRAEFLAHTFFIWLMYFLMSYFLFISMVEGIKFFQGLWVMVSGGFGMVFPSPGGIGSYQEAVVAGFKSIGFTNDVDTYAVANVIWITQTLMLVLSGIVGSLIIKKGNPKPSTV
tara:strand:- start:145 stop:1131 length:987 start_codon:yes stop_codon:yes gene_type:complete